LKSFPKAKTHENIRLSTKTKLCSEKNTTQTDITAIMKTKRYITNSSKQLLLLINL